MNLTPASWNDLAARYPEKLQGLTAQAAWELADRAGQLIVLADDSRRLEDAEGLPLFQAHGLTAWHVVASPERLHAWLPDPAIKMLCADALPDIHLLAAPVRGKETSHVRSDAP